MSASVRRLGVDLGERFVGLSVHEEPEVPARPLPAVDRKAVKDYVSAVAAVAAKEAVGELVVGLPLRLDGGECAASRGARRAARELAARTGLRVRLWDERLTTVQAARNRSARGVKGREGIDSEAAALLLQAFVDAQSGGSGWQGEADDA